MKNKREYRLVIGIMCIWLLYCTWSLIGVLG